jgi:hypothetical protein
VKIADRNGARLWWRATGEYVARHHSLEVRIRQLEDALVSRT